MTVAADSGDMDTDGLDGKVGRPGEPAPGLRQGQGWQTYQAAAPPAVKVGVERIVEAGHFVIADPLAGLDLPDDPAIFFLTAVYHKCN